MLTGLKLLMLPAACSQMFVLRTFPDPPHRLMSNHLKRCSVLERLRCHIELRARNSEVSLVSQAVAVVRYPQCCTLEGPSRSELATFVSGRSIWVPVGCRLHDILVCCLDLYRTTTYQQERDHFRRSADACRGTTHH